MKTIDPLRWPRYYRHDDYAVRIDPLGARHVGHALHMEQVRSRKCDGRLVDLPLIEVSEEFGGGTVYGDIWLNS